MKYRSSFGNRSQKAQDRSGPSPCPAQRRDPAESSDCADSLEYSTSTQRYSYNVRRDRLRSRGRSHAGTRGQRRGPGVQARATYSLVGAKVQEVCSLNNPPSPPAGLTHGSDPRSGVKGGSRRSPPR